MKIFISLFTLVVAVFISSAGYSQDSLRKAQQQKPHPLTSADQKDSQQAYYRQVLGVDSVKSEQVSQIQDAYKAGMKVVLDDKNLSQDVMREKIKGLMEEKNKKLMLLLTPDQQEKIIPGTERIKQEEADSVNPKRK